jgi:hypothetical protein
VLWHDYAIIHEDGCITTQRLVFGLSISKGSVIHTRWVSQSLTFTWKTKRKAVSSMLLVCFQALRETFPSWIVTADKTWFHHFELQTERQSVEWCYHFPQKKEFRHFL